MAYKLLMLEEYPLIIQLQQQKLLISLSGDITCNSLTTANASITQAGAISGSSISTSGNITASGTITSQGSYVLTATFNPFYCAGQVSSSGNLVCSTGRYSFTVTQHITGVYWVTYRTAYRNSNYVIIGNSINTSTYIAIGSATSSTQAELIAVNSSNPFVSSAFYFMVF